MERQDTQPQNWWNTQIERRMNELHTNLDAAWRDIREEIKAGNGRQYAINNLDERVRELRKQVEDLRQTMRDEVMTKEDFKPYRNGIVLVLSTIVLAVLGALTKLVIVPH